MNRPKHSVTSPLLAFSFAVFAVSPAAGQGNEPEQEVEALRHQVDQLQEQLDRIEQRQEPGLATDVTDEAPAMRKPHVGVSPTDGLRFGSEESFIDISLIGSFIAGTSTESDVGSLYQGHHDPLQRGFTVSNVELTLRGIVDPYFRAQSSIVMTLDEEGETELELEEAYFESLALPGNVQLRGGHFYTEFGRLNQQHPHYWSFVDQPLINNRMFGPDGLRNPGARLSWLVPTSFYSEAFFTVQNSGGETAYSFRNEEGFADDKFFGFPAEELDDLRVRNLTDLLYALRYAASGELTRTQTLLGGVSAAFGPNATGEDARTEIYGVDLYWLWTPVNQYRGFPFLGWQTEAMLRRFEVQEETTFQDYGFYTQLVYGFTPGWVAGLRYEAVRGDMNDIEDGGERLFPNRVRVSPNLTYYPSEFTRVRLQYNYHDRRDFGIDHSVWLQWEFGVGPHGAHAF